MVLVQEKKKNQQQFFCSRKKRQPDNPVFAIGKRQPDNLFLGIFFTERFSYSDQIQRTVFG